jgi:dephospho-CoA kinase
MNSTAGPSVRIISVGLTGGIACGRTTVCAILARLGACVIDMDDLAHALVAPGGEAVSKVAEAFGDRVSDARGGIDRKVLGAIVFHDPARRAELEAILHPMIRAESEKIIGEFARSRGRGIAVTDAALLVETGAYRRYDRLVVVVCDPRLQLRRLMARDSLAEEEARARIAAQAPLEEKLKVADHVIDTSGTLAETEARAHEVYALLLDELDRGPDPPKRRRT